MGCRQLQDSEIEEVEVDACGDAQTAAEGAHLGLFEYDELKKKKKKPVSTRLYGRYRAWYISLLQHTLAVSSYWSPCRLL